jgi:hypothetical protein
MFVIAAAPPFLQPFLMQETGDDIEKKVPGLRTMGDEKGC